MASELAIGFVAHIPVDALSRPDAVTACVGAYLSPAWGAPLRYLLLQGIGGRPLARKPGNLALKARSDVLASLLVHPDVWCVVLMTRGRDPAPWRPSASDYGTLSIETRDRWGDPYLLAAGWQELGAKSRESADVWIAAMVDLAGVLGSRDGVFLATSLVAMYSEESLRDDESGARRHPAPAQLDRMRAVKWELGTRYVRFPRWGTIYSKAHVAQLGGVERIREVVRPAVIRELGAEALYFQLTESVATATSDEAVAKERAFTELAAPLLPPPVPAEG